jgi:predicted Zn-dependent peptidase
MDKEIKKHEFPNGCRIVYQKSKNTMPITSINVLCNFGSAHEEDGNRGVAHFIEHMCFKGTKKIPHAKEIFREYDDIGAHFNASTNKRYTVYIVKCMDDYIENCVRVLSDMVLNSVFDKKEFTKELKVVIEENIRNLDNHNRSIYEMTDEIVYRGSPYEFPVDSMDYHKKGSLKYENVIETYHSVYQPCNFIINIVSNISFTAVVKMISKSYFIRKNGEYTINNREHMQLFQSPEPAQHNIQYVFKSVRESNATLLNISFRTCSQFSKDKYVLNLLKTIVGGYFSSRLFFLLREDNGLTYNSSVDVQYYESVGDFTINVTTDYHKLIKNGKKHGVLPLIINMLNNLRKEGISQKELTLAKHYKRGKLTMKLENIDNIVSYNGEQVLLYPNTTQIIPFEDIYDTYYKNITKKTVDQIIKTYIVRERMNICLLGQHLPSESVVKNICDKIV